MILSNTLDKAGLKSHINTMSNEHTVTVERAVFSRTRRYFQPVCSCGWKGELYRQDGTEPDSAYLAADAERTEHYEDAQYGVSK